MTRDKKADAVEVGRVDLPNILQLGPLIGRVEDKGFDGVVHGTTQNVDDVVFQKGRVRTICLVERATVVANVKPSEDTGHAALNEQGHRQEDHVDDTQRPHDFHFGLAPFLDGCIRHQNTKHCHEQHGNAGDKHGDHQFLENGVIEDAADFPRTANDGHAVEIQQVGPACDGGGQSGADADYHECHIEAALHRSQKLHRRFGVHCICAIANLIWPGLEGQRRPHHGEAHHSFFLFKIIAFVGFLCYSSVRTSRMRVTNPDALLCRFKQR